MKEIEAMIDAVLEQDRTTLSEFESAHLMEGYGIPMARGLLARDLEEARRAADRIGYPVALKLCSPEVSHKTEGGWVAVNLRDAGELESAHARMEGAAAAIGQKAYLVQEMVRGDRELVIGMVRDPQFGPCVMFGLGGIFTELLGDVTFRPAPLAESDAAEMLADLRGSGILGAVRGMEAADRQELIRCLVAMGQIGLAHGRIQAIDVNPLILRGGSPVAVDALVVLAAP